MEFFNDILTPLFFIISNIGLIFLTFFFLLEKNKIKEKNNYLFFGILFIIISIFILTQIRNTIF